MKNTKVYRIDGSADIAIQHVDKAFLGDKFVVSIGLAIDDLQPLWHIWEHRVPEGNTPEETQQIVEWLDCKTYSWGGWTSEHAVWYQFVVDAENCEEVTDFAVNKFTSKVTRGQLKGVIPTILHEVDYSSSKKYSEEMTVSSSSVLLDYALGEQNDPVNIIGTKEDIMAAELADMDILREYVNKQNLIISISSAMSVEEMLKFAIEKIVNKIPDAKSVCYVSKRPERIKFVDSNFEHIEENSERSNLSVGFLFRDEMTEGERDLDETYVVDYIEEKYHNSLSTKFYDILRNHKHRCYALDYSHHEYISSHFKSFEFEISPNLANSTIKLICGIFKSLRESGIPEEAFEEIRTKALKELKATGDSWDARDNTTNFEAMVRNTLVYNKENIIKYFENITYERFNELIMRSYEFGQMSYAVIGNCDQNRILKYADVERLIGKQRVTIKEEKAPIYREMPYTVLTMPKKELNQNDIVVNLEIEEDPVEQTETKPSKIDDKAKGKE